MSESEIIRNIPPGASGRELAAYLDEVCGSDADLRARVGALFRKQEEDPALAGLIQDGLLDSERQTLLVANELAPGTVIGRYKLLSEIGEGGFGVVYMADQLEPVKRRVALKIIKLGMDTRQVVARFEAERQALALMDHPNIAQVFDAGTTDRGRPYFVMELVKGVSITKFCAEHRLNTRQRLELFMEVCSAVQHAHQKGIIHRDLKPSNIIVAMHGDRPTPKVIDFGIAKATQVPLTDKTLVTHFEQLIGTPVYMSPEQAALSGVDVDTRSDVYSLGVLLYELLTGKPPFDSVTLAKAGYDEVRRIIREEEPPKPSTCFGAMTVDERVMLAKQHHANPDRLGRIVRGDLDWIVMKAMEKARKWRFETVGALIADIQSHLEGLPVPSRRRTFGYLSRKFLSRNRRMVAGVAISLLLMVPVTLVFLKMGKERALERAGTHFEALFTSRMERVPLVIGEIEPYAEFLDARLQQAASDPERPEGERARAQLALVSRDPTQILNLCPWLLKAEPAELDIALGILENHKKELAPHAWDALTDETAEPDRRLRAAAIAAAADAGDPRWSSLADQVTGLILNRRTLDVARWLSLMKPVAPFMEAPLRRVFHEEGATPTGEASAIALAEFFEDDIARLVSLVPDARAGQLAALARAMGRRGEESERDLLEVLRAGMDENLRGDEREDAARAQARVVLALLLMDRPAPAWSHLHRKPDPSIRTYIIHGLAEHDVNWRTLTGILHGGGDAGAIEAVLQALGDYNLVQVPPSERASLRPVVEALYAGSPDPGVRSSAEWLLRQWKFDGDLRALDEANRTGDLTDGKNWYVTKNGNFTMASFSGPRNFEMGSPQFEQGREENEDPHTALIDRSFAISTKEVTVAQFMEFARELEVTNKRREVEEPGGDPWHGLNKVSLTRDTSCSFISLKEAMVFCWWLSRKEGIPAEELCYEFPVGTSFDDAPVVARQGYLQKTGYRLPTEAEWEFACRAGTITPRYYGSADELLSKYAWYWFSFDEEVRYAHPPGLLRPNAFGLFDTLGNMSEYCAELYLENYRSHPAGLALSADEPRMIDLPKEGRWRVSRGGSFFTYPDHIRAAMRSTVMYSAIPNVSFRIARTLRN